MHVQISQFIFTESVERFNFVQNRHLQSFMYHKDTVGQVEVSKYLFSKVLSV